MFWREYMDDTIIEKISNYLDKTMEIEDFMDEATASLSPMTMPDRSYIRWAVYEIMNRIMDRPYESPEIIVERFLYEMISMIQLSNPSVKKHIFKIGMHTAEDILKII